MASTEIKLLCVKLGISVAELARKYGSTPQAFGQKMKRDSFTTDELNTIANSVGCKYESSFILPDGERITERFFIVETQKGGDKQIKTIKPRYMSDADLERRCRYRLSLHNMKMHKLKGLNGASVYYLYGVGEDDSPPEYEGSYFSLDQIIDYCEELEEKDNLERLKR